MARSARIGGKGVRDSRVRISRRTKRPVGRAPNGVRQAEELLSEAQVRDGLRLDADAIAALKACCSLRPPRNAAAIVAAIKARLEYSQPKPVQKLEHAGVDGAPLSITFAQARRDPT